MSVRNLVGSGAVAVIALLPAVACEPIPHPVLNVRVPVTSAVTLRLLSGNGRFVVVSSTGPTDVVPDRGLWRVERSTGAAVRIDSPLNPVRISANGARVLLNQYAEWRLWTSGQVVTPPSGVFADDLTYAVFVDGAGRIARWRTSDGAVTPVEDAFPRPPGVTSVAPTAVSDDGRVVSYRLDGTDPPVQRFVDLGTGSVHDTPAGQHVALAADGVRYAQMHVPAFDGSPDSPQGGGWVELVDLPSGHLVRRYDNVTDERLLELRIGRRGDAAWVYRDHHAAVCPPGWPVPLPFPISESCVMSSSVVAISPNGDATYDLAGGYLASFEIDRFGRFGLVSTTRDPWGFGGTRLSGPTKVIDRVSQEVETLELGPEPREEILHGESEFLVCFLLVASNSPCDLIATSTGAHMSDDQRVIAASTSSGRGWVEFTAEP